MEENYFYNNELHVEALFEDTDNLCICSRVHLKDYHYVSLGYNTNVCEEDPEMPHDDELSEELELMKSMGLPTSFGKKYTETAYEGFYFKENADEYDFSDDFEASLNLESNDLEECNQNAKDMPVLDEASTFENAMNGENVPTMVFSVKEFHEAESEAEEPEDVIKELGFVIKSTNSLRIIKKHCVHESYKEQLTTDLEIDNNMEDYSQSEESEKNCVKLIESSVEAENKMNGSDDKTEEFTNETVESERHVSQYIDSSTNENVLEKYWVQRYRLFHRFDEGIKLDKESWFSVTPESIAKHIAERCACGVMIDAFCGAGSNAIQFATVCYHVIAIDKDPKKIELAKHNAAVYGVADFIDFIVGDYFDIAPNLSADGVFLSPPWGGPSYADEAEYNIDKIDPNIYKTFEVSRKITENIVLFVPKTTIINQLVQLSGEGKSVEIEQNILNKKFKTITAYYGAFVNT